LIFEGIKKKIFYKNKRWKIFSSIEPIKQGLGQSQSNEVFSEIFTIDRRRNELYPEKDVKLHDEMAKVSRKRAKNWAKQKLYDSETKRGIICFDGEDIKG